MKRLHFFIGLLSLSVLFSSCSEDETISFDQEKFAGEWQLTGLTYEGTSSSEFMGARATTEYEGEGFDMEVVLGFTRNPNEMSASGDYKILLEITTQGQTITEEWTNQQFMESGSWTLNGDELKVAGETTEQTFKVQSLDDTIMKLVSNMSETSSQAGITTKYDVEIFYTFERQ